MRNENRGTDRPLSYVYSRDLASYDENQHLVPIMLHPAIFVMAGPSNQTFSISIQGFSIEIVPEIILSWTRGGMWENMLISQPGCGDLFVSCASWSRCPCNKGIAVRDQFIEAGTLGALRDEVERKKGCTGMKGLYFHGVASEDERAVKAAQDFYWFKIKMEADIRRAFDGSAKRRQALLHIEDMQ